MKQATLEVDELRGVAMRTLLASLVMAVAACGGSASNGSSTPTSSAPSPAPVPAPAPSPTPVPLACNALERGKWTAITPKEVDLSQDYAAHSIAVDPLAPGRVYIGTASQGMFRTEDCGASFIRIATGTHGADIKAGRQWSLVVDPVDANVLYTNSGYGALMAYKSTDAGVNWKELMPKGEQRGFESGHVHRISMDPKDHKHLIVTPHFACVPGAFDGVEPRQAGCLLETFDAGATWRFVEGVNQPISGEGGGMWMEDKLNWYWALMFGGLRHTTDGGAHWTTLFTNSYASPGHARDNAGALVVGGVFSVLRSTDGSQFAPLVGSPGADGLVDGGSLIVTGRNSSFAWADKSNLSRWTTAPDLAPLVPDPSYVALFYMDYDPVNRVIYTAMSKNGFWRYALP